LQQAGLGQVFTLYQLLAGRSLIRSQSLATFRLDLGCKDPATTNDLVKAIEQALAPKGILFRQDGDRFTFAGRETDLNRITPQLRELASTIAETRGKASEESLPAGTINFPGTDVNQVLMIYQELVNRSLLHPATLPAPAITFRSYTPWTFEEAIYAFNASLAINGISVVPVGEKFLFVFPTVQKQKMDSLLKSQLPVHHIPWKEALPTGVGGPPLNLRQMVAVYSELCEKPISIEADLPNIPFIFKNQTPLTAQEVLHALDLILAWNGLQVTQDGEKGLKLTRRAEAK
jgi:hypothetical protein